MTSGEAIALTESIRHAVIDAEAAAGVAVALLVQARASRAWAVMGYRSFSDYVHTEFRIVRNTAWRRLTQALVAGEISDAAGLPRASMVVLSQRAALKVRPKLEAVARQIAESTATITGIDERRRVAECIVAEAVRTAPGERVCPTCAGAGRIPGASTAVG